MAKADFIFFWGGIYSQWEASIFIIDNIQYSSAEQYMMAKKAKVFNDDVSFNRIMTSHNPQKQQEIGRNIKGFDKIKWDAVCRDIVYIGNYAKFTQNPKLKTALLNTGDKELVEASPIDKIWGIGLKEDNPLAWNKSTWEGTNWLGIAIMQVREKLRNGN